MDWCNLSVLIKEKVDNGLNHSILYDLLLHVIPALVAGLGAYYGVKYAIRDHAIRIDLMLVRQGWVVRKIIHLITLHNTYHPESFITVDDFPKDPETTMASRI